MRACVVVLLPLLVAAPSFGELSQDQLRSDLQYLVAQLPKVHVNLFYASSSSAFYGAAAQLETEIPKLSNEQFYTRMAALVAMANDAHTRLVLSGSAAAGLGFNTLPIEFRVLADGIFVVSAPANGARWNGARLVKIGNVAASDVYDLLTPVVPHVNGSGARFGVSALLSNSGVLRGIGAAPSAGPIPFTFQLASGAQVTAELSADGAATVPSIRASNGYLEPLLDHPGENYWSEYWAYARTVYVRYAQCVEMASRSSSAFTAETLALIDRNPVDTLIIDLRANSGGSEGVTIPLTSGLIQRMSSLRANPRFRVYVFIDGGVESAALNTVADLKYSVVPRSMTILGPAGTPGVNATLVGEPTGGKPGYCGGASTITLPESRLAVRYSTICIPVFEGLPEGDALYPDLRVDGRSTDYFARYDPTLGAALAHAAIRPSAPSGRAIVVNSASMQYETGVAPGSFASAFGEFPAGELKVTVNGASAQVIAATQGQVNFVIPADVTLGRASMEVRAQAEVVSDGTFEVTGTGPGLFVADWYDQSRPGAILNQDSSLNGSQVPAPRGSILQIFATGSGLGDPAAANVWIANRPAEIPYSGPAPGYPALWQINARIPQDAAIEKQVPVFVSLEGRISNAVTIYVTGPHQ